MFPNKSHYRTLGIPSSATQADIKKAYKKLALKYHPDKASKDKLERNEAIFKQIVEAYEVLSDPAQRQSYNVQRAKRTDEPVSAPNPTQNDAKPPKRPAAEDIFIPEKLNKELESILEADNVTLLTQALQKLQDDTDLLKNLLYYACRKGKLRIAKYLIEIKHVNPNLYVKDSRNDLCGAIFKAAAQSGSLNLVKYLLETHHVNIEAQGHARSIRSSALSRAVLKGHLEVVRYLIARGPNVNPEIDYSDILKQAIATGILEMVQTLVAAGTDITQFALQKAFETGHLEIVQYLLQKKPKLESHWFSKSPACAVISSGNVDLLKHLETHENLELFKPHSAWDNIHLLLLCAAAKSMNKDMLNYILIEKGLINFCKNPETAVLYIGAMIRTLSNTNSFATQVEIQDRIQTLQFLIEEYGFVLPEKNLRETIIGSAKSSGIEINAYLQSFLPCSENSKQTLLKIAQHGLDGLNLLELFHLYNARAISEGKYEHFESTIHSHIQNRNISVEDLKANLKGNIQGKIDALFYYSDNWHKKDLSGLKAIIQSGIDINSENIEGEIAAHFAARQNGYNDMVKFHIEQGADIYKKNKYGKSLFDLFQHLPEFNEQIERFAKKEKTSDCKQEMSTVDQALKTTKNTILKATPPQFIKVADKPLNQGGKISYLTPDEFQKRFGVVYDESIYIDPKLDLSKIQLNENVRGYTSALELKSQIKALLKNPNENLVICDMGPVGQGLFSEKRIPKNTVIALYAGTLTPEQMVKNKHDHAIEFYGTNLSFSTQKSRGLASFMQHLPEQPKFPHPKILADVLKALGKSISENQIRLNTELYNIAFNQPEDKTGLKTENIRLEYLKIDGVPVIAMVANEDIEPGHQLGFNYGYPYWLSRGCPEYFDKDNNIIPSQCYQKIFGQLQFNGFSYTGAFKPLIEAITPGVKKIMLIDDKNQSQTVDAIQLLSLLIKARAFPIQQALAAPKPPILISESALKTQQPSAAVSQKTEVARPFQENAENIVKKPKLAFSIH